MQNNTYK